MHTDLLIDAIWLALVVAVTVVFYRSRDRMAPPHYYLVVAGTLFYACGAFLELGGDLPAWHAVPILGADDPRHRFFRDVLGYLPGLLLAAGGLALQVRASRERDLRDALGRLQGAHRRRDRMAQEKTLGGVLREGLVAVREIVGDRGVALSLAAEASEPPPSPPGREPLTFPVRLDGDDLAVLRIEDAEPAAALLPEQLLAVELVVQELAVFIDRLRREDALREQRRLWHAAVSHSPVGLVLMDAGGRFLEYNHALEAITGYRREQVPDEESWCRAVSADRGHAALLRAGWRQAVYGGGGGPRFEVSLLRADGEERQVAIQAQAITGDGPPGHYAIAVEDLTDRNRALRALAESEHLNAAVVNQVPSGLCVIYPDTGEIAFANETLCRMSGYARDELLRLNILQAVAREQHGVLLARLAERAKGREDGSPWVYTVVRKDGSRFQAEMAGTLVAWQGRKAFVVVVTDITDRLQAAAALNFQREITETALRRAPLSVAILAADRTVLLWNERLARVYGLPAGAVEGRRLDEAVPGAAVHPISELLQGVLQSGRPHLDANWEVVGREGATKLIDLAIYPLFGSGGEVLGAAVLGADVTEHRAAEERYRQAAKMNALGQLAGGVAHDFKNLMTVILGNVSLARLSAPAELQPVLRDAEQAAQRAAGVVRQLLAFARRAPARMAATDANEIAAEAVALLRHAVDRRLELALSLLPEPALVWADSDQLHQVIVNLVLNARDALMERLAAEQEAGVIGPREPYRITLRTRHASAPAGAPESAPDGPPARFVVLAVQDTGIGIDEATRQRLFEPFFTTKEEGKGTGLGLATAYGVIRQHGGWIDVTSRKGEGALFEVYLPESPPANRSPLPDLPAVASASRP